MKNITILLLFVLLFIPISTRALTKGGYYKKGDEIMLSKDWKKGKEIFKAAVREYPNEIVFHTMLNFILRNAGNSREALDQIIQIYQRYPYNQNVIENYKWSLNQFGWDKVREGKMPDAFELFKKSYQLINDEEWGINAWGYILKEVKQFDESISVLTRGKKLFPDNLSIEGNLISAYLGRAEVYRRNKSYQNAETDYKKALVIQPNNEWLLINYGSFLRDAGKYEASKKMLEKGLTLYPKNKYMRSNLVHTIFEYGKYSYQNGEWKKVIHIFEEGIQKFPNEVWFYYYLADYYNKNNNPEEASKALIQMATVNQHRQESKDFELVEKTIYHQIKTPLTRFAANRKTDRIFSIISQLRNLFSKDYYVFELNGEQKFHAGFKKEGIELVYQAYENYIKLHPEFKKPIIIGVPLKGIYTVLGNNSRDTITHAGLNRYCFDFVGSTETGKSRINDSNNMGENEDYFGFGRPIYSTADGVIDAVIDNHQDLNPSNEYRLLDGNYISIKDQNGFHHTFVHNRYKSAKVQVGQGVKKGQVIAELGNTGMTSIPHLHFAVYSEDGMVSLPVKFESYVILNENFTKTPPSLKTQKKVQSTPDSLSVIRFE